VLKSNSNPRSIGQQMSMLRTEPARLLVADDLDPLFHSL